MKEEVILLPLVVIVIAISVLFMLGCASPKVTSIGSPYTCGHGFATRCFTVDTIDLGLREDGVVIWRNKPPIPKTRTRGK